LHYNESLVYDETNQVWKLDDAAIDPGKTYRVAISEFLFTGKEANLEFLSPQNPEVIKTYEAQTAVSNSLSDIRLAIVRYLEKKNQ
jgi:5'-nucleotidase